MDFLKEIEKSFISYRDKTAFCIGGNFYSYSYLHQVVNKIRLEIRTQTVDSEKIIGIVDNGDIETYAAIIALWFEGKAYVPLNPHSPEERNRVIIEESGITTLIDSSEKTTFIVPQIISTKYLTSEPISLPAKEFNDNELSYILFTSGTTGKPKGVPISRKNLQGFVTAFNALGFEISHDDRFLQMFDLTFDLSVMSYLIPLTKGACCYTLPAGKFKYGAISEIMEDQEITFSLMVPSVLHYLRPYFDEIQFPELKYSLFCGEALPHDLVAEWVNCAPNASIRNVYGPTEDTIFCTSYTYRKNEREKSHSGILSIGKAMLGTSTIVVDANNQVVPGGTIGELCLGGIQLTPGYWHNEEKNREAFFKASFKNIETKFYKTGDLCFIDNEKDLFYVGRIDSQVKIQGFRVELSEIEHHCKSFLDKTNLVALTYSKMFNDSEIGLAIEADDFDYNDLINFLKRKMPSYMVPSNVKFFRSFPLNANGKTDRKALAQQF